METDSIPNEISLSIQGPVELLIPEKEDYIPLSKTEVNINFTCKIFVRDNYELFSLNTNSYKFLGGIFQINENLEFPIDYTYIPKESYVVFSINKLGFSQVLREVGQAEFCIYSKGCPEKVNNGVSTICISPYNTHEKDAEELQELISRYESWRLNGDVKIDRLLFPEIQRKIHECKTCLILRIFIDIPHKNIKSIEPMVQPKHKILKYPNLYESVKVPTPIDMKYKVLSECHRSKFIHLQSKPASKDRQEIKRIIKYSIITKLTLEEKDLLWKFRYYLKNKRNTLPIFLRCVTWTNDEEANHALNLIEGWASVSFEDALELLNLEFAHIKIQEIAIRNFKLGTEKEILLHLFHLVYCIYLESLKLKDVSKKRPLANFLIRSALNNPEILNAFYWYLVVVCQDIGMREVYKPLLKALLKAMTTEIQNGKEKLELFLRQEDLIRKLQNLSNTVKNYGYSVKKKTEKMRAFISNPKNGLNEFEPVQLPFSNNIVVKGIVSEEASVFNSSLCPLKIPFLCTDGSIYYVMYKVDCDLRLDQLLIHILRISDNFLRNENLESGLTLYYVIPTSLDSGIVQLVPSMPLSSIIETYGSIASYVRSKQKIDDPEHESLLVMPEKFMMNYIRSMGKILEYRNLNTETICIQATYSVIMYMLSVGDRHLDNILVTEDGKLFHIDFGYIFGKDPRLFSPLTKISKEMLDAIGQVVSRDFNTFELHCQAVYLILRKYSRVILNIIHTMNSTRIFSRDFNSKGVADVLGRFKLRDTEEEAMRHIKFVITESISSVMPELMEKLHYIVQMIRN